MSKFTRKGTMICVDVLCMHSDGISVRVTINGTTPLVGIRKIPNIPYFVKIHENTRQT